MVLTTQYLGVFLELMDDFQLKNFAILILFLPKDFLFFLHKRNFCVSPHWKKIHVFLNEKKMTNKKQKKLYTEKIPAK